MIDRSAPGVRRRSGRWRAARSMACRARWWPAGRSRPSPRARPTSLDVIVPPVKQRLSPPRAPPVRRPRPGDPGQVDGRVAVHEGQQQELAKPAGRPPGRHPAPAADRVPGDVVRGSTSSPRRPGRRPDAAHRRFVRRSGTHRRAWLWTCSGRRSVRSGLTIGRLHESSILKPLRRSIPPASAGRRRPPPRLSIRSPPRSGPHQGRQGRHLVRLPSTPTVATGASRRRERC